MEHLVITVIAADQAGLVERVAHCISEHQGNWLESRLSRMAGQFAGIVNVAVPSAEWDGLLTSLRALSSRGIRVQIAERGGEPSDLRQTVRMELVGNDRPGIVRDISRVLAQLAVNVERLSTQVQPAPMSNEPLFHAEAVLALPAELSLERLQQRLEGLADELMVELSVRAEG
ncbi:glycine cleavage system protein R [Pseudomonas cremoricolorata]|uniref:Glycine cleavage system transcriptional repressor n=1 Tax=Pseudomonas cremoricolorata TaxID=157783 RepID=A0A089WGM4_9PSED|nr:ACT domain-containing protein [Pseudomonas cremoricolorata]AIR88455.1 glycine cleavage system protein R [Pseudomonas cremoricolorata]